MEPLTPMKSGFRCQTSPLGRPMHRSGGQAALRMAGPSGKVDNLFRKNGDLVGGTIWLLATIGCPLNVRSTSLEERLAKLVEHADRILKPVNEIRQLRRELIDLKKKVFGEPQAVGNRGSGPASRPAHDHRLSGAWSSTSSSSSTATSFSATTGPSAPGLPSSIRSK